MLSWEAAQKLALSLPEVEERDHFGSPSFRVKGKIFAQLSAQCKSEQRALVKLSNADQSALIMSAPDIFSSAPHWGHHGWTYVMLASVQKSILRSLFLQSWRLVAPKQLVATHQEHEKTRAVSLTRRSTRPLRVSAITVTSRAAR
jgi:hypothetical protein